MGMAAAAEPDAEPIADLGTVSTASLTTFVAFTVTAAEDGKEARAHFVLNLPLDGGPDDRQERILEHVLQDRRSVLRFILLLLADDHRDIVALQQAFTPARGDGNQPACPDQALGIPLFETLMHALHRDRSRLERVGRLVADLSATEHGRNLLPEGFESLWAPFREVLDG